MKFPERIYFGEADKSVLDIYSTKEHDDEVEYVRNDVFIEKAAKWINEHTNLSEKLVIEDFKKYIEE